MTFDREIIEEQLALHMIEPPQKLAWDALEAGYDGRFIRRLAASDSLSGFEFDELLPRVMAELNLSKLSEGEAAERIARRLARKILDTGANPLEHTLEFEKLWWRTNHECSIEMTTFGSLHDEVTIARHQAQSEESIRAWVTATMENLLSHPSK